MTTSFIVLVTCKLCKWKWHKRDFYPKEIIEKHLFTKKITAKIFIRGKGYIIWRINFLLLPLFSFIRRTRKTRFKLYHLWLIIYPSVFCFVTQIYEAYIFAKLRGKCKKEKIIYSAIQSRTSCIRRTWPALAWFVLAGERRLPSYVNQSGP
jgi:hypothetical protein